MLCLLAQAQRLLTQVPVKISVMPGRPKQKQRYSRYSPSQVSLGVGGDRQERALASGRSNF